MSGSNITMFNLKSAPPDRKKSRMPTVMAILCLGRMVLACDDATLRDAAFQGDRDIHHLCVITAQGDSAGPQIHSEIQTWLKVHAADANIDCVLLTVDDPNVAWGEYGMPSAPPSYPAVVFAGYHTAEKRGFFIDYWTPRPSANELESILSSPVRESIRNSVGASHAVLLYAPGSGEGQSPRKTIIDDVIQTWSSEKPLGLSLIELDRANPQERILISFLGIGESQQDWVGVVFGRGKLMPPLEGEAITKDALTSQLSQLEVPCTCLRNPGEFGVDLPLLWESERNTSVVMLNLLLPDDPIISSINSGMDTVSGYRPIQILMLCIAGFIVVVFAAGGVVFLRVRNRNWS